MRREPRRAEETAAGNADGTDEVEAPAAEGNGGTGVNGDAPPPGPPDAVGELEDRLRRALADLDNLRKRFTREVVRERDAERARVASVFLPVVDNLDRALEHADDGSGSALVEGIRAVRDQAVGALSRLGFPRFDDVGVPFDPVRHEAVGAIDGDGPPGTVAAVTRPGYGTPDTILRPAGVLVAKGHG